jgi:hypothetical protein
VLSEIAPGMVQDYRTHRTKTGNARSVQMSAPSGEVLHEPRARSTLHQEIVCPGRYARRPSVIAGCRSSLTFHRPARVQARSRIARGSHPMGSLCDSTAISSGCIRFQTAMAAGCD